MASNEAAKLEPRSRIRNRKSSNRSFGSRARLRGCRTVYTPVRCAVTPPRYIRQVLCSMNTSTYTFQRHRVYVQEVVGQDSRGLGVQELPPRRA